MAACAAGETLSFVPFAMTVSGSVLVSRGFSRATATGDIVCGVVLVEDEVGVCAARTR